MEIESLPSPIAEFYTAFQKGDMNGIVALYVKEATLQDPGIGFLLGHTDLLAIGRDNIERYYFQAFSNMPTAPVVQLERWWQSGNDVLVQYTEGMMTYLEVFTLDGGKIKGQQVFWGSIPPAPMMRKFNS